MYLLAAVCLVAFVAYRVRKEKLVAKARRNHKRLPR
jgi:hypothetical protein